MALAPLVLPSWNIEAPSLLGEAPAIEARAQTAAAPAPATGLAKPDTNIAAVPPANAKSAPAPKASSLSAVAAATAIYAIPAAILLFITFLALGRLIALRARADVLVDGHWLSALARAQRRMGFKHGTALLTSNELASPISWGLMRPVILLNSRAVEASGEAEAIIAHELAHVARMDWVKLLLARVATALFWFNPFVWLLAREAHQLREETADDAVLAADIPDTDYAQLLVGVARHDCPSMLLGAHGVAPSRSSLARRVARVLDGTSVRGPAARGFAVGVFAGAVLVAAPLAALTFTPKGTVAAEKAAKAAGVPYKGDGSAYYAGTDDVPSDLPSIISQGVATSVQSAVAAINPKIDDGDFETVAASGASVRRVNGITTARAPSGATVTVYPPDASGRRKVIAISATGAKAVTYADADDDIPGFGPVRGHEPKSIIERAIEMKAVGVTPDYMSAMKAASPALRDTDPSDFVGMKAVGVTPDYVRGLASVGFGNLDSDDLTEARAVGVTGDYIRAMRAAGYNGDLDDFVEMRAVGITPAYADQFKKAGYNLSLKKLVDLKANRVDLDELRVPGPPQPPRPPRLPSSVDDDDD
jgi:beta-lactamase regulating signal transducer with metallopeptidase domain